MLKLTWSLSEKLGSTRDKHDQGRGGGEKRGVREGETPALSSLPPDALLSLV